MDVYQIAEAVQAQVPGWDHERAYLIGIRQTSESGGDIVEIKNMSEGAGKDYVAISTQTHVKEAQRMTFLGADCFMVCHTHPNCQGEEDCTPSGDDYDTADAIQKAFDDANLSLIKDFIITEHAFTSVTDASEWARHTKDAVLMHKLRMI